MVCVFRCVLKIDNSEMDGSEMINKPWADLGKSVNTARIYRWLHYILLLLIYWHVIFCPVLKIN